MSKKSLFTRGAAATIAMAGALALTLPGAAGAAPTVQVPTPELSAKVVDGDKIEITVKDLSDSDDVTCLAAVLKAEDALPLATLETFPPLLELLPILQGMGNETTSAEQREVTNVVMGVAPETFEPAPLEPGVYAAIGACMAPSDDPDNILGTEVAAYTYQIVFLPGGFGSLSQGLGLGSTVLKMDGGSGLIMDQLFSGAASSMLGS